MSLSPQLAGSASLLSVCHSTTRAFVAVSPEIGRSLRLHGHHHLSDAGYILRRRLDLPMGLSSPTMSRSHDPLFPHRRRDFSRGNLSLTRACIPPPGRYLAWTIEKYRQGYDPRMIRTRPVRPKRYRGFVSVSFLPLIGTSDLVGWRLTALMDEPPHLPL